MEDLLLSKDGDRKMEKMNAGLIMLAEMREKLPPSEKKVASYILENPTRAIKMTAVELGEASAIDYLQAQQVRRQIKQEFTEIFNEVDVLITPTLPVVASTIGDDFAELNGQKVDLIDNIIRFTGPSNLTGLPARRTSTR